MPRVPGTTLLEKVSGLVANMVTQPQFILPYLRYRNAACLDCGLPWISFPAIEELKSYLRPQMTVFEYGTGGSTVFFAQRSKRVISVENSAEWCDRTRTTLKDRGLNNAIVEYAPTPDVRYEPRGDRWIALADHEAFTRSHYVTALAAPADLVMVDGAEDFSFEQLWREVCFRHAEPMMKPGGMIVLDDSWAYPNILANNRAIRQRNLVGLGPGRTGVTSTAIFYY